MSGLVFILFNVMKPINETFKTSFIIYSLNEQNFEGY